LERIQLTTDLIHFKFKNSTRPTCQHLSYPLSRAVLLPAPAEHAPPTTTLPLLTATYHLCLCCAVPLTPLPTPHMQKRSSIDRQMKSHAIVSPPTTTRWLVSCWQHRMCGRKCSSVSQTSSRPHHSLHATILTCVTAYCPPKLNLLFPTIAVNTSPIVAALYTASLLCPRSQEGEGKHLLPSMPNLIVGVPMSRPDLEFSPNW
jgi:hypothetical protein